MKKSAIIGSLVSVLYGSGYIVDIDRNGIFNVIPDQINTYSLSIRGNNYVKIKVSPVNCRLNIYNDKKRRIATTSLIDFGFLGRLKDGNYYFTIKPIDTRCRSFELTTQEQAFFTISNKHKDQNVLSEEKQLSQTLMKDMSISR